MRVWEKTKYDNETRVRTGGEGACYIVFFSYIFLSLMLDVRSVTEEREGFLIILRCAPAN